MSDSRGDPPAFPESIAITPSGDPYYGMPGMTLRQYLAGQALAGLCANPGGPFQANGMSGWGIVNCTPDDIAAECLRLADALIDNTAPKPSAGGPADFI